MAGASHQVGVSENPLVASGGELLRPVDDGRLEEAAAAQLEEGRQVPHDAQTVEGQKFNTTRVRSQLRPKCGVLDGFRARGGGQEAPDTKSCDGH